MQGKWSLLHTFALSGQIHFMDKLLDNGFDIDTVDKVCLKLVSGGFSFFFFPFLSF